MTSAIDSTGERTKYLTLVLNREAYGIESTKVREIIHSAEITKVSLFSSHMRGITNLRGRIIPVMDLSSRLGLRVQTQERPCVVILQVHGYKDTPVMMGFATDGVGEIFCAEAERHSTEPGFGRGTNGLWPVSATRFRGRNITLLDIDRVVASELAPVTF